MPAVSVITPTYNRAAVLPRAIKSLRGQTVDDYEHIIVDDGSTDSTPNVVEEYRDERTRYIPLSVNRGTATALNHGLDAAEGNYISFLDSDDMYYPRRLELAIQTLESHDTPVGGLVHSIETRTEAGTEYHRVPAGVIEFRDLADANVIRGNTNTMFKAHVVDEIGGFDEHLPSSIDYDFQLRAAKVLPLVGVDTVLCHKDDTVSGMQDDPSLKRQGLKRILHKHGDLLSDENVVERSFLIGTACLELGDIESAREWFDRAVDRSPPTDRLLNYRIGRAYLEADHRPDARSHLRASLREDVTDYRRHILFWSSYLPASGPKTVDVLRNVRDRVIPGGTGSGIE